MEPSKSSARIHGPKSLYKKPGALVITLAVILLGVVLTVTFLLPKGQRIDTSGYQVVYMASGQSYFGKLQNTSGEYLVLRQPYSAQNVAVDSDNEKQSGEQTSLLKVSDQLYGPEDVISLKSDQVLFWQNLRSDSKVTQAIRNRE